MLIAGTICVLALDFLIISILSLAWYALDWCANNIVCNFAGDVIGAVTQVF